MPPGDRPREGTGFEHLATDTATHFYCPECTQPLRQKPWPVEPLYNMSEVALLVPMPSAAAVRAFLCDNSALFPPRYRFDYQRRKHRMLTATEVRMIRDMVIRRNLR